LNAGGRKQRCGRGRVPVVGNVAIALHDAGPRRGLERLADRKVEFFDDVVGRLTGCNSSLTQWPAPSTMAVPTRSATIAQGFANHLASIAASADTEDRHR
jgi:hypothetical protein